MTGMVRIDVVRITSQDIRRWIKSSIDQIIARRISSA